MSLENQRKHQETWSINLAIYKLCKEYYNHALLFVFHVFHVCSHIYK